MSKTKSIYISENGQLQIEVAFEQETVWLTQAQLVRLFGSSKANISEHIKNIINEGELQEEAVVRKFRTTAVDGNKRSGSFLFLWYLRLNQHLLARPVEQLINNNTLVALALLVAESLPEQKELIIHLIEHFILLKEDD